MTIVAILLALAIAIVLPPLAIFGFGIFVLYLIAFN